MTQVYYTTTYAAPSYYTEVPQYYTEKAEYYATAFAATVYYTEKPKYYSIQYRTEAPVYFLTKVPEYYTTIKPENILVSNKNSVKMKWADFGHK